MAKWVSIKQAADYMGLHPASIYNAISRGEKLGELFYKLPGTGTRRASIEEIDLYMKGGNRDESR